MNYECISESCKERVREAAKDPRFSVKKFKDWFGDSDVARKNSPSAWFAVAFPRELAKGTFYKDEKAERKPYTVEEYLHMFEGAEDFPEPINDEDEMNQDEARKLMWEGAVKTLGGDKPFHEPIPQEDREEFINHLYPEYVRDGYRRHPEYFENTWIAVYRESRERGEPMRKTCERKGLKLEALIV